MPPPLVRPKIDVDWFGPGFKGTAPFCSKWGPIGRGQPASSPLVWASGAPPQRGASRRAASAPAPAPAGTTQGGCTLGRGNIPPDVE
ncbi:hypothetical protein HMPREF0262_00659 [Clostridium sp. ATCC 29733]|nr:hypothetical protein HMPREF0262_00659 [Clostridium sp. ATCC 29733]